jgi:hypothetical protein
MGDCMLSSDDYRRYREKYLNSPRLDLKAPVDISLELSSYCNQYCTYCVDPETPVLTIDREWKPIKDLQEGDKLIAFDEHEKLGRPRCIRESKVEKVWWTKKESVRLVTTRGWVICSLDHQFIEYFGPWRKAEDLSIGDSICFADGDWAIGDILMSYKAKIISIEKLGVRDLVDIQTSTHTFIANHGFLTHNCYHNDKKNLPFKQQFMLPETFKKIVREASDLGVNSLKTNWRGESTMNPFFATMTHYAKQLAIGDTFLDRITNSNFKFPTEREDIFQGLCNQTKVKVSYDSFIPEVFEKQRAGGKHAVTTANIDKFYNYPGRDNILVIQAVRTSLNKDEDIEGEARRRWPSALVSIRDMVEGRVEKDLSEMTKLYPSTCTTYI